MKIKIWSLAALIVVLIGAAIWWIMAAQEKAEPPLDRTEELEKARINEFFSELDRIYGFLSTTEDGSLQLFLKIDEALREGELTGSLLVMADTGDESKPYEERTYDIVGITDGKMVEIFTNDEGKQVKMIGNFHGDATEFDVSFWQTDEKLIFRAVTEEEYVEKIGR
ncbi:hypothetical protein [Bacillus niameyensis]|uniref:hypothetical protein n=1 Tax=Bacillus niameyensis TaxID=1522308 RepID=UPI000786765A|nr:hypothetical protein [Bacillus niameyensis]